jgi:hypothetical protein
LFSRVFLNSACSRNGASTWFTFPASGRSSLAQTASALERTPPALGVDRAGKRSGLIGESCVSIQHTVWKILAIWRFGDLTPTQNCVRPPRTRRAGRGLDPSGVAECSQGCSEAEPLVSETPKPADPEPRHTCRGSNPRPMNGSARAGALEPHRLSPKGHRFPRRVAKR